MNRTLWTVWGKTSGGFLLSNVGKLRPKNIYNFQNNLEGFFKYRSDHNIIVEYFCQPPEEIQKIKDLINPV